MLGKRDYRSVGSTVVQTGKKEKEKYQENENSCVNDGEVEARAHSEERFEPYSDLCFIRSGLLPVVFGHGTSIGRALSLVNV